MITITINANHGVDFPVRIKQTMTPNDISSLLDESIDLSSGQNIPNNLEDDLKLVVQKSISYEYIHNGRILNSYLSLASQGVVNGSKLDLISKININNVNLDNNVPLQVSHNFLHLGEDSTQHSDAYAKNVNNLFPKLTNDAERLLQLQILEKKSKTFSTQSEKIASLLTESFRIYDGHFSSIERYPRSQISYQRMLQMVHTEADDDQDQEYEMVDENGNIFTVSNCNANNETLTKSVIDSNSNTEPSTEPLPALNLNSDCDESEEFDEFVLAPMFESIEQAGKLFAKNPWSEWTW